ncbi:MAG: alpha/beta hydrolase [Deltaproteobacteria bacterium]|nr:alpha/beta hydrolase [Deltaproteobacteria bacterium]
MKLIFIHGSGGCKESWQYQTQYFEGSEAIDLPGHPDGDLCETIDEYVAWVREYILEKGYQDIILAGHSLGGAIALKYALDYPEDLKCIILIGSGARLRVHPSFLESLEKAVDDPGAWEEASNSTYDLINPELADIIKKRAAENGPGAFLNDLKACDRFDVMDRIASLKVPLFAICGDQDMMTPPKYSNYLVDKIAGAKAVIIPGGTHFAFAEKPLEVNKAIEAFL